MKLPTRTNRLLIAALATTFLGGVALFGTANAQAIPTYFNYQGRLTSPIGVPVTDGSYTAVFRIFKETSGGSALWSESLPVTTKNGVFAAQLGHSTTIQPALFKQEKLFIEVEVDGRVLGPRQQLGSVAMAAMAMTMPDGSVTTAMIASAAVTTVKLGNGSVRTDKILDGAVTEPKLGAGAVTFDKIANSAVGPLKLASDAASLEKVSAGRLRLTNGIDMGNLALGTAHNEQFQANGFSMSRYGLQFQADQEWTGAPVARLSGWNGIKLYTGDTPRWSVRGDGTISHYGRTYINNRGWVDPTPYVDLAIGDNDTGLNSEGDGRLGFYSNGRVKWETNPSGMMIREGGLYIDRAGGERAIDLAVGDTDTGIQWRGDGSFDLMSNGEPRMEVRWDRVSVVNCTKQAVVDTKSYGRRSLYSLESAQVRFTDEGTAKLSKGEVVVKMDPVFLQTTEGIPNIHLTPYGDSLIYVARVERDRFVVRARKGEADVSFAWNASYPRKGFADRRLEKQ